MFINGLWNWTIRIRWQNIWTCESATGTYGYVRNTPESNIKQHVEHSCSMSNKQRLLHFKYFITYNSHLIVLIHHVGSIKISPIETAQHFKWQLDLTFIIETWQAVNGVCITNDMSATISELNSRWYFLVRKYRYCTYRSTILLKSSAILLFSPLLRSNVAHFQSVPSHSRIVKLSLNLMCALTHLAQMLSFGSYNQVSHLAVLLTVLHERMLYNMCSYQ